MQKQFKFEQLKPRAQARAAYQYMKDYNKYRRDPTAHMSIDEALSCIGDDTDARYDEEGNFIKHED